MGYLRFCSTGGGGESEVWPIHKLRFWISEGLAQADYYLFKGVELPRDRDSEILNLRVPRLQVDHVVPWGSGIAWYSLKSVRSKPRWGVEEEWAWESWTARIRYSIPRQWGRC